MTNLKDLTDSVAAIWYWGIDGMPDVERDFIAACEATLLNGGELSPKAARYFRLLSAEGR